MNQVPSYECCDSIGPGRSTAFLRKSVRLRSRLTSNADTPKLPQIATDIRLYLPRTRGPLPLPPRAYISLKKQSEHYTRKAPSWQRSLCMLVTAPSLRCGSTRLKDTLLLLSGLR